MCVFTLSFLMDWECGDTHREVSEVGQEESILLQEDSWFNTADETQVSLVLIIGAGLSRPWRHSVQEGGSVRV